MATYLRISNRGGCPRDYLMILGATTKRDRMGDASLGGWFGSDTKFAAIAALELGIPMHVASSDERGPYIMSYGIQDGAIPRVVFRFDAGESVLSMYSTRACPNWTRPIGDDPHRAYRVLRGPFRNAMDENGGETPYIDQVDEIAPAPEGMTCVYIGLHPEIETMLSVPERYFKCLALDEPAAQFTLPHSDVPYGRFWPKSEPDATRLFAQGTLAYCARRPELSALFDYDFDDKSLVTEERTFEDLGDVLAALGRMLACLRKPDVARAIIAGIAKGHGALEAQAMESIVKTVVTVPAAETWKQAWYAVFGEDAVLSAGPYADELARASFKKNPLLIENDRLARFLRRCGVPTSLLVIPDAASGWRKAPLEPGHQAKLDQVVAAVQAEIAETKGTPVFAYEALSESHRGQAGFCLLDYAAKRYAEVYVNRDAAFVSLEELVHTVFHEHGHIAANADDASRKFAAKLGVAGARMLIEKYGLDEPPPPKNAPVIDAAALRKRLGWKK